MSSINELLKQVYPLNLRMELFNAIWTSWRAYIKEKDQQITDLQSQLTITEKALKLACETIKQMCGKPLWIGGNIQSPEPKDNEYFKYIAKEMLENE